ncbi:MAG: hypothetical protein PHG35_08515 [Dehalococcoidales bacterium]|nr:hypothetical protein [Dehalococcoidales bacterium]
MDEQEIIRKSLDHIFKGIDTLREAFNKRQFTVDGRLVGDLGEIIAELNYDVILYPKSKPFYDGESSDGKKIQIKATFQDELTFGKVPEYYLGFKLFRDGRYEEIYNGPGMPIFDRYNHRKNIGVKLLRFPNSELRELASNVPIENRIKKRH